MFRTTQRPACSPHARDGLHACSLTLVAPCFLAQLVRLSPGLTETACLLLGVTETRAVRLLPGCEPSLYPAQHPVRVPSSCSCACPSYQARRYRYRHMLQDGLYCCALVSSGTGPHAVCVDVIDRSCSLSDHSRFVSMSLTEAVVVFVPQFGCFGYCGRR